METRDGRGLLWALSVFLVVLMGFSVHDLSPGAVAVGRVASHGLLALGLGLLCATERTRDGGGRPPAGRGAVASRSSGSGIADGSSDIPLGSGKTGHGGGLRPTARRDAA